MSGEKVRKYLNAGLLGAIVTVAAELLQGFAPSPDTAGRAAKVFSSIEGLPVWRMGLGSTLGALGILLQLCGFYALYLTFKDRQARCARLYRAGMVGFTVIGAIVHVLCSVMMLVYKVCPEQMEAFVIWFMLPIMAVFFAAFGALAAAMFVQIGKGRTAFPRACCVLNPVIGKAVINGVAELMPAGALANGIGFANMGLTSLVTFAVMRALLKRNFEKV